MTARTRRLHLPVRRATLAALALSSTLLSPAAARAGEGTGLVVVREHGVGSAAQAQQYLDRLAASAARVNGWSAVFSKYFTSRRQAKAWIQAEQPAFGILTLDTYLALRAPMKLSVVGKAEVKGAGGRRYHVISKDAKDLAGCKGKPLASNHLDDTRFVERVVAGGAFKLADFQPLPTRRPLQTVKKVLRGEATCALVDDAQLADLANVEGGAALHPVWSSKELPPMVVVAFGHTDPALARGFKAKLSKVCSGAGKQACAEVGISRLAPASDKDYRAVVRAYGS